MTKESARFLIKKMQLFRQDGVRKENHKIWETHRKSTACGRGETTKYSKYSKKDCMWGETTKYSKYTKKRSAQHCMWGRNHRTHRTHGKGLHVEEKPRITRIYTNSTACGGSRGWGRRGEVEGRCSRISIRRAAGCGVTLHRSRRASLSCGIKGHASTKARPTNDGDTPNPADAPLRRYEKYPILPKAENTP